MNTLSATAPEAPALPALSRRRRALKASGRAIERVMPENTIRGGVRKFAIEALKDHDLWVRASAIWGGSAVITEGTLAIYFLLAMPVGIAAAGIVACGTLMALGLYGIYAGATGVFKSVKNIFTKSFRQSAVSAEEKKPEKAFFQKFIENPRFEKLVRRPFMQKIVNGRAGKILGRVGTQRQKDILMASLTLKGSLVVVALSSFFIATQAVALTVATIGTIVSAPILGAAWLLFGGIVDSYRGAKVMIRSLRPGKKSAHEPAEIKVTEIAPPAPAVALPAPATLAKSFDESASPAPSATPATEARSQKKSGPPSGAPPSL